MNLSPVRATNDQSANPPGDRRTHVRAQHRPLAEGSEFVTA
jgi:hypothetical protein